MRTIPSLAVAAALSLAAAGTGLAQTGKSLTIAVGANINTLDPHQSATVGTDLSVLSHVYPAMLKRGPDLKLKPDVAKSWKAIDDKTWQFELDERAVFSNGEKIDAEAIKWNLDRVRDPKLNARIRSWFTLISEVVAVDGKTVQVKTASPYPALPDQLSMFFLLPPGWAKENNPVTATMAGDQYRIAENVRGSRIVLTPNAQYWSEKAAYEKVTFRIIPESSARIAALSAGEVDYISQIPVIEVERLNKAGRVEANVISSTRSAFLKLNLMKPPLDNKAFRQALNYAVDKKGISDALFSGKAELSSCQLMSPHYFGYNPDLKPYPYDPAKARELLKQSGVDLAQAVEFEIPTAVYLQGEEVVQAITSQLADVGIKTRITEMEFGAFMNKHVQARNLAPIAYLTYAWPTIDADGLLSLSQVGNVYDYWADKPFSDLVTEGRATVDPAKRMEAYRKATARMCEEAPVVFLFVQPVTYGTSKRVSWKARGDDWVRAGDFSLR